MILLISHISHTSHIPRSFVVTATATTIPIHRTPRAPRAPRSRTSIIATTGISSPAITRTDCNSCPNFSSSSPLSSSFSSSTLLSTIPTISTLLSSSNTIYLSTSHSCSSRTIPSLIHPPFSALFHTTHPSPPPLSQLRLPIIRRTPLAAYSSASFQPNTQHHPHHLDLTC